MYACMHARMHRCIDAYICIYVYVCSHARMYMCTYTYVYVYGMYVVVFSRKLLYSILPHELRPFCSNRNFSYDEIQYMYAGRRYTYMHYVFC